MTEIIIHGCAGRMGHFVAAMADKADDMCCVAGVDPAVSDDKKKDYAFPVFKSIGECDIKADVIIDFGTASAVDGLLDYCSERGIPCVLCTTGLSKEQLSKLEKASEKTAILRSANMSYGVNLLMKILKEYSAALCAAGFDVEIVEKHHNQKIDSPSGTAISLAESVNASLSEPYAFTYDRSQRRIRRPKEEIGISAVRGGSIVGDHDVIFAGKDEVITFSHMAYSRELFANGAILAARFLNGRAPGMYSMEDV